MAATHAQRAGHHLSVFGAILGVTCFIYFGLNFVGFGTQRGAGGGGASAAVPVTEAMASGFRTMRIGSAVQMVVMGSD